MFFLAPQTVYPSGSALVDHISTSTIFTTSKTIAYEISTKSRDVSLMSSSPKPTGNDFGIEEGSGIEEESGNVSDLNLLLISTVTVGGKCIESQCMSSNNIINF